MTLVFFFNDPPTTEIYTLSLHYALPTSRQDPPAADHHDPPALLDDERTPAVAAGRGHEQRAREPAHAHEPDAARLDRKSTRLNSSHANTSYAVFCLKKKLN